MQGSEVSPKPRSTSKQSSLYFHCRGTDGDQSRLEIEQIVSDAALAFQPFNTGFLHWSGMEHFSSALP